ncbi:uncharacterized protein OCT59_029155 [Rhizophagus irregularis]|uniref:uncharacterized protein n=1 Tax=Rhizophagus irregularis TaxID=588596 RepID=UPI003332206C|nr:hypothetical protein OCT59_029155 [Rhizophagus irregularis]
MDFAVVIDSEKLVSHLKEAIKTKNQNFNRVEANELRLWKIGAYYGRNNRLTEAGKEFDALSVVKPGQTMVRP